MYSTFHIPHRFDNGWYYGRLCGRSGKLCIKFIDVLLLKIDIKDVLDMRGIDVIQQYSVELDNFLKWTTVAQYESFKRICQVI